MRLSASANEITKINEQISLESRAYDRYIQEANSINLSEEIKSRVREGAIDIREYDEDTAKLISEYQEFYEKALDCSDAIDELKENLSELYSQRFDAMAKDFDNQLSLIEHRVTQIDNAMKVTQAQGYFGSESLYKQKLESETQMLNKNREALSVLERALNTGVQSGSILVGSESWYDMQSEIEKTKEEIQDATLAIIECNNAIRELEWDRFDYAQDRISQITDEASFLLDLLDDVDKFDDNGQLNDNGLAALSMNGIRYNTFMSQADQYREALQKLNVEIQKDPYNKDLIARREELLKLQQDSIESAQSEKQAITDLIKDGIDKQIESLNDLIDKYKDSINNAKDLYDYQKKVAEQTDNVASLQKQLEAYSGDMSEENRARLQRLNTELAKAQDDLKETQYDQYIKDQEKLLDQIASDYESTLNERLDNVDALISDVVSAVNSNSDEIANAIENASNEVGYDITQNMNDIINGDGSIIAVYNGNMTSQLTTLNGVVSRILAQVEQMSTHGDSVAVSHAANSVQGYSSGGYVAELQKIAMQNGDDVITVNTLKKGESVLTSEQTQALMSMASDLPLMRNILRSGKLMSSVSGQTIHQSQNVNQSFGDLNIMIDHVEDYNDLVTKMRDDPKFERLIQAMTIDRMAGKGNLSKYNCRWK